MTVVHLRSLRELQRSLRALGEQIETEVAQGLRNAARYGATAVLRTSRKTSPRPRASGTYDRSWLVTRLDDGAVLSNAAAHSIFVERGRRPGKRPPLEPILEWIYQKRMAPRPKRKAPRKLKGRDRIDFFASQARNVMDAHELAEAVRWKIAHKGTRARWILRRTMPAIAKRASLETKKAIRKVTGKPRRRPRRRRPRRRR